MEYMIFVTPKQSGRTDVQIFDFGPDWNECALRDILPGSVYSKIFEIVGPGCVYTWQYDYLDGCASIYRGKFDQHGGIEIIEPARLYATDENRPGKIVRGCQPPEIWPNVTP